MLLGTGLIHLLTIFTTLAVLNHHHAWGGEEGVGWWDPMAIAGNLLLFTMGSGSFGRNKLK
jgi:uncharacterized membrane protein YphA (DoxX/SURF4 family)